MATYADLPAGFKIEGGEDEDLAALRAQLAKAKGAATWQEKNEQRYPAGDEGLMASLLRSATEDRSGRYDRLHGSHDEGNFGELMGRQRDRRSAMQDQLRSGDISEGQAGLWREEEQARADQERLYLEGDLSWDELQQYKRWYTKPASEYAR